MPTRFTFLTLISTFLVALASPVTAQTSPDPAWPVPAFTEVVRGLTEVVDIQNAGDGSGRLFLVEQRGTIRILKNGALLPSPFLDMYGVTRGGEQGLLGLAFPPGYAEKQHFYVFYTSGGNTVVSRIRAREDNPDRAEPWEQEIILETPKPDTNHNGGQIAFGPDGYLYIAIGDGGGAGDPQRNSQNLTNRLGKILRIDVENTAPGQPYSIPATNPFATSTTRAPEILCWGLRNPWRFSFDPINGDLFIGDVGELQREEINHVPAAEINSGINFGWSVKEGTLDFVAQAGTVGVLRPPAFEYGRSLGSSVTGGLFYQGADPRLQGFYLFGDFGSGRIWAMERPAGGGRVQMIKDTYYSFSTFGKDEAGEIYFSEYGSGEIYRIGSLDTLPPPVVTPAAGVYTAKVSFSMTTDVPGAVVRYTTDGSTPTAASPAFTPGATVDKTDPFTLKAATFRTGLNPSAIVERSYEFRPEYVQIGTGRQSFNDYTTIQLTCPTPGTQIRYTTDGTTPTTASPLYSPGSHVSINRNMTVQAIAIRPGAGWLPSLVASRQYYLTVSEPRFTNPIVGMYDTVDLTSDTPGASLYYSVTGSGGSSMLPWPGPHELPAGTVLVSAEKTGMTSSSIHLTLRRISEQGASFEKLPGNPGNWILDLVRVNDTTFYAIDSDNLWKLQDGVWSSIYPNSESPYRSFAALTITADGKIAIAYRGNPSGIVIVTASGTPVEQWNLADYASPMDLVALPTGGFLLPDYQNNRILKINGPSSSSVLPAYEVFGGTGSTPVQADLERPRGIVRDDAGNIYFPGSSRLRRLDTSNMVTTLAGSGQSGWTDGPAASARFKRPVSIARDRLGNCYVAEEKDSDPAKIRKITPEGQVFSLRGKLYEAGSAAPSSTDSFGIPNPQGMVVDDNGILYVAGDYTITRIIQHDWDNDGIPDTAERSLGTPFVVGVNDRVTDSDGDQLSNLAEWIGGTNPAAFNNSKAGTVIRPAGDGSFALQFSCDPAKRHQLEYSGDLRTWKPMGEASTTPFKSFTATVPKAANTAGRFYRLKSTP